MRLLIWTAACHSENNVWEVSNPNDSQKYDENQGLTNVRDDDQEQSSSGVDQFRVLQKAELEK